MSDKDRQADRVEELRKVRRELLKKIGLPPDTPPHEVREWLKKNMPQAVKPKIRKQYFSAVRSRLLNNLRLPDNTPPGSFASWLEARKNLDKLNELVVKEEEKK